MQAVVCFEGLSSAQLPTRPGNERMVRVCSCGLCQCVQLHLHRMNRSYSIMMRAMCGLKQIENKTYKSITKPLAVPN